MYSEDKQRLIRLDIFEWLNARRKADRFELTREELNEYAYQGDPIPLLDRGRGIRNPRNFDATLSILTSYDSPFVDEIEADSLVRYRYRAGNTSDNAKLRVAFKEQQPMIYFQGIRPGAYVAVYPVYAIDDDPIANIFTISLDESTRLFATTDSITEDQRRYAARSIQVRLHQPVFRAKVMNAYGVSCAICQLKHSRLLDAAHILPDSHIEGFARVNNGLALCKIHHAAYDSNLLGITPDFTVKINAELMLEIDGPMLLHGLQEMQDRALTLTEKRINHPSREGLRYRFEEFSA